MPETGHRCILCGATDPKNSPHARSGEPACWIDDDLCSPCGERIMPDLLNAAMNAAPHLAHKSQPPHVRAIGEELDRAVRQYQLVYPPLVRDDVEAEER